MTIFNRVHIELPNLPTWLIPFIQITFYVIIGIITYKLLKHIITRVAGNTKVLKTRHHQKRAETIKTVVLNIIKYLITIIIFIAALAALGVDVRTLIAALGITGVLIGLAFQDIAKDFIAGLSIIAEDQYEIGDIVEIGGFKGVVSFVGLRTTRIKDDTGATKIISNSRVTDLINYNLNDVFAIVDLKISNKTSMDKIEEVLEVIIENTKEKLPKAKEIKILGIETLDSGSITYRIAALIKPSQKQEAERILRKEIKVAFDQSKIEM